MPQREQYVFHVPGRQKLARFSDFMTVFCLFLNWVDDDVVIPSQSG